MFEADEILTSDRVAISVDSGRYPSSPPYSPGKAYPEYPFGSEISADETNHAYDGVRDALRLMGCDVAHYGRKDWSPLGGIIRPGDTVVLKPNFIREFRETQTGHEDCLITHGSIIRAVLDYAYIALQGRGRIVVADAPQNDADFDAIRRITGLDEIQEFYRNHAHFDVEVFDLRPERAKKINGVIIGHEPLPGDPGGYVRVDLGRHSMFAEVENLCHLLYGSEYDTSEIRRHHSGGIHEYLISGTVLNADCVINLPKLKTHKKTGITVCLKNLVGINGNKNWLPHHRLGTPAQGGDQFADDCLRHRIERTVMAGFRRLFPLFGPARRVLAKPLLRVGKRAFGDTNADAIRSGNWYGNDTTWRMVLDLNRILLYADCDGHLRNHPTRRLFCIVDGIIAGEGNGPLDPTAKRAGLVLAGANPLAVDLVAARLMDFDFLSLPMLSQGAAIHPLPLTVFSRDDVACVCNVADFHGRLAEVKGLNMRFRPHFGWRGHIECTCPERERNDSPCVE
jgi:uncharacterized protein (DUF362 family)